MLNQLNFVASSLLLLACVSEASCSSYENGACKSGDCSLSTVGPVQSSPGNEADALDMSTSSHDERATEEGMTASPEETSSGPTTSSELITSTSRDLSATSSNMYSPPTALPNLDSSVLRKRMTASNRSHPFGDHCPCDLLVGSCDPNCCCDVLDCSEEEKEAFSTCLPLPPPVPDPRLCQQSRWLSTLNHTLELQDVDSHQHGLLCITRDNNPSRLALADYRPARSLKDYQELIGNQKLFRWSVTLPDSLHFMENSSYKVGDVLWSVQGSSLLPLELESSGFNSLCQSKKLVRYLENWKSSCVVPLQEMEKGEPSGSTLRLQEKCAMLGPGELLTNAALLSSPLQWPYISALHTCPHEMCIHPQQWVCSSPGFDDCIEVNHVPTPVLQGDSCVNALVAVRLVIDVMGVSIHSAQAYFVLSNTSLSGEAISREHSVIFKWWSAEEDIGAEFDKDRIVWKRSGSPGYITGEPVMAGWKETVVLGGEQQQPVEGGVLEAIRVTPHPEGWLTLLGPKAGTQVCGGPRKAVRFGHSARWSCSLAILPSDLTADGRVALRRRVLSLLLGWDSSGNLSERFIAMFGDSVPEKVSEWLPLKMVSHDGKELDEEVLSEAKGMALYTSVHLEVATALVGSVSNPQAKVLGALLRMGPMLNLGSYKALPMRRGGTVVAAAKVADGIVDTASGGMGGNLHLTLVSSVKFMDVSSPPVMQVAPPPVYHIRLPHNFFHPFLSSSAPYCRATTLLVMVLYIVQFMAVTNVLLCHKYLESTIP